MAYGEACVAALSSSFKALQDKIEFEVNLPTPDTDKLAGFKRKLNRIKDEIDAHRIKLVSAV